MDKYCPKCKRDFPSSHVRCEECDEKLIALDEEKDLSGQKLDDRYRVVSKLGEGGMGIVYIAEQTMVGRKVALKVLRKDMVKDKSTISRFFTEAKAIASLGSSHTITLYDFGVTDDGLLYYTMELLSGHPLADMIKQQGAMDYRRAADILLQAADSLEEAHEAEILHRDLKPDNLFISEKRGKDHVTILDFGIAKLMGESDLESVTRTGMICGTPAYLSPEQILGNPAVPASDLYSLGILFYEMLAGIPPFKSTTPMKLMMKHLNEKPQLISIRNPEMEVPASIDRFIQKALEKEAVDRFQTVAEFRVALQTALNDHEVKPETVNLSSMSTSSVGLRSITDQYGEPSGKSGAEDDLVDSHGETAVVRTPVPGRIPAQVAGAASRTMGFEANEMPDAAAGPELTRVEVPPTIESDETEQPPGTETMLTSMRSKGRLGLYAVLGSVVVGLIAILAVWQPWLGTGTSSGDSKAETRTPARSEAVGAEDKKLATGDRQLATDQGQLATGNRQLATDKAESAAKLQAEKKALEEARTKAKEQEAKALALEEELAKARSMAQEEADKRVREEKAKTLAEKKAKEEEAKALAEKKAEEEAKALAERKAEEEAMALAEKKKALEESMAKAEAQRAKAKKKAEAKKKADEGEGLGFERVKILPEKEKPKEHVPDDGEDGLGFERVKIN